LQGLTLKADADIKALLWAQPENPEYKRLSTTSLSDQLKVWVLVLLALFQNARVVQL
jgi:hypothetical protein